MIGSARHLSTLIQILVNRRASGRGQCPLCLALAPRGKLCPGCTAALPLLGSRCGICALPLPYPAPACGRCQRRRPAYDRIEAGFAYRFPVNGMITRFKFHGEAALVRPLTHLLAESLQTGLTAELRPQLLIPCPSHNQRYRKRGFNQAAVIAAQLGRQLNIPVDYRLCRRTRATPTQTGLNREARLDNLRGAFELKGTPPGRVAIVDDVVTTGATAEQLAGLLKAGGAEYVSVWALARTPMAGG